MRPLCLTMTAFGPYAGEQKLDFRELQERTFFLIHGPTGAGKTTILDGMCFALYGDTSGVQRDGKSMRSDHAEADSITEVIFDFAIGEDCYQVKRLPEQDRPKKRGEGTTTMLAEAQLWSIPLGGQPKLLAVKWIEVTRQIEMLLGFKSSQFRQVVLLPQGDFRKLLTANSSERQEIMQALFKTDMYRILEEKLKDNAQQLKKNNDELTKQRQWILQEAGAVEDAELKNTLLQCQVELESLTQQMKTVSVELKQTQQAVNQGMAAQEKIHERQKAEQLLRELTEQKEIIDRERQELVRAIGAAGLLDAEKNLGKYAQELLVLEENAATYESELSAAIDKHSKAQQQFEIETSRESEQKELARQIDNLQQVEGRLAALQQARQQVEDSKHKVSQGLTVKQQISGAGINIQEKIDHLLIEQKEYAELVGQAGARQVKWKELQLLLEKRIMLDDNRREFAQAQQQATAAALRFTNVEEDVQTQKTHFQQLQQEWVQGQAALMAANLVKGIACPVCGSTEHPKIADSAKRVPDEKQIKKLHMQIETLEKEREKCRSQWSELQTEKNTWENRVADLLQELNEKAAMPLRELQQMTHTAKEQLDQVMAAEKIVKEVEKQLENLVEELGTIKRKQEQADENWRQAESFLTTAEAVAQERQAAVPKELQEKGALKAAQQSFQQKYQQCIEQWKQAQENVLLAQQSVIKIQTVLDSTKGRLVQDRERYEKEQKSFSARVLASGYIDQSDYEMAKKSQMEIQRLEEKVGAFDRDFNSAAVRVQQAAQGTENLLLPDMISLEQAAEAAQHQYNTVFATHTNLETKVMQLQAWLKKIKELDGELEKAGAKYSVVGRLAEVANGGNEYKLTLQRFVLGTLLENVTVAANERLKMMSRGRYYLQRTMDRARKNAAGGLELEVYDHYTGIARGVGTLSGGETFLASLSLALGLADVVQSYSGGMHLETILVDEGFGTLDPESLDFAIKALVDLQQGGRLVGIISHVPELKERIDARLEVMATERGSKAYFRIG
jgi:exonuclease SbcC